MNRPRSTEPRPLFKHVVIGSCRTYSNIVTDKPQAAITYNNCVSPLHKINITNYDYFNLLTTIL